MTAAFHILAPGIPLSPPLQVRLIALAVVIGLGTLVGSF